jgi:cyclophilin family peptidyl-prolyl cis-trans isomerase
MYEALDALATDDNPEVRWRAAYAFSRSEDSLALKARVDRLQELLHDQGAPSVRMFAALAFGRLHDAAADTVLVRAYRGEPDWRVQVNILNAFGRFPHLDSMMLAVIRSATEAPSREDKAAMQRGWVAQMVLEQFITSAKLTRQDSTALRTWLAEFDETRGFHEEVSQWVAATATVSAARLGSPDVTVGVQNYAQSADPLIRNIAVRAAGVLKDTSYFAEILQSMPRIPPVEQLARLDGLNGMWQSAKEDPAFRKELETKLYGNIYRHLLIRIPQLVVEAGVVSTALENMKDTTIISNAAFRDEANTYVRGYLSKYLEPRYRDQLLISLSAMKWLADTSAATKQAIAVILDSATQRGDAELRDSAAVTYAALGHKLPKLRQLVQRHSSIDWGYLESMPERMVINLVPLGSIELRLEPYYAPLTCLRMVQLAKQQYFTHQSVHRVVPNFVIQSGDPGATGWNGPGYMMRTEISPLEFDREGDVGMASSGKDTEGSQWFITECPTPHLTTRYTVWAHVVDGMKDVLNVVQGDVVDTMIPFSK